MMRELIDLWAAGCILYTMLCGYQPFHSSYVEELIEKIKNCDYSMDNSIWEKVSPDAKDLVRRLLQIDPDKRETSVKALQHPWFTEASKSEEEVQQSRQSIQENIRRNRRRLTRNITTTLRLSQTPLDLLTRLRGTRYSVTPNISGLSGLYRENSDPNPNGVPPSCQNELKENVFSFS